MSGGWKDDGACVGILDGTFDPLRGNGAAWTNAQRDRTLRAIGICAGCPVITQCGAEGAREHHSGVWGGRMLAAGRALRLPTAQTITPCGTEQSWRRHRTHREDCPRCEQVHADRLARQRASRKRANAERRFRGVA